MRKGLVTAASAAVLAWAAAAPVPAETPDAPPPAAAAAVSDNGRGVLTFTPEFFADQRPNTALEMVNRIPGFSIEDGDGSRGFEGSVGNVLINGDRPASKNDTGSNVLGRTLASQVARIELIRGGAPGIDMQGYSVVVNVITSTESSRQSVLTANANLFDGGQDLFGGSYQFTARDGERTWGVTLSDGISMSDSNGAGPVIRVDGAGAVLREEFYFNDNYGGSTSVRGNYAGPALGGGIDLTARYGVNDFHAIDRLTAPGVLRESLFDEEGTVGEFGAVYSRPLGTGLELETRFMHTFEEFESVAQSQESVGGVGSPQQRFVAEGNSGETIARALVRWERTETLSFETGGEIAYNMLEVDQAFSIGGIPVPLPSASVTVEETRGEAFGKATWRARPSFLLETGLRLETSTISQSGDAAQDKSFFFAKPRLLATWTPMADTQIRVRFERELGQLDFGDFAASADLDESTVLGGNVDLEPEQRWVSELTLERRFWDDGIISIGLRHDEIVDAIDVIPLDMGLSAVGNIGDGTLDQLVVNILVPTDRFGFTGGRVGFRNTWNHTEVTDPTTGRTRPLSGVRPSQPTFTVAQDIASWNLQWGAAWIPRLSQRNYHPDQVYGWRGRDYFEVWAEYKPTPTLALRAQLNLWDHFDLDRTVYADRTTREVAYEETRFVDPRTFVSLRLRKTF